jgi:hypothetical protein
VSNSETPESRRQLSSDATLGLERLIVGRECNAFDRLSAERKALAYAELIRLGLIDGTVKEVPGQSYPDVRVTRVTSRGKKAYGPRKYKEKKGTTGWTFFIILLGFAVLLLLILGIITWH